MQRNRHTFSFYYKELDSLKVGSALIKSDELFHRFKNVLRINPGDLCVFFNQEIHGSFEFSSFEKKNTIIGMLQFKKNNVALNPKVTFLLPLLKIDALSTAVYSLAEVGVTNIQLVATEKTQTKFTPKLLEKLQKVVLAAAEQSKQYAYPNIISPIKLASWLDLQEEGQKFYFDASGVSFASWHKSINLQGNNFLLIGPEGDLTSVEKERVQASGFTFCLLTPTILRASSAAAIAAATLRI